MMQRPVQVGLSPRGAAFLPGIMADPAFLVDGIVYGFAGSYWWAVVDPYQHPLCVWQKTNIPPAAYSRSGRNLNAAIFTNGPMMGKRFSSGRKITKMMTPLAFASWTALGGVMGVALTRSRWAQAMLGALGAAAGVMVAWQRIFVGWTPCGYVISETNGIDDRTNFDDEGDSHAWIGRFGTAFGSYQIDRGNLPTDVVEGMGGMILIAKDFAPVSCDPDAPSYDYDFAHLHQKRGVVAWGLAPLAEGQQRDGVLVVLGSHQLDLKEAATYLCDIGVRDAVATDQRGCVMLGSHKHMLLKSPAPYRQTMQSYGLYCH